MRERDVEAYLVERAIAMGGEVRKLAWIGRRGAPDRVVMLPPSFTLWVEVKAPGEKLRPHQAREHERMRAMGQQVVVVDSMDAVDAVLGARRA